MNFAQLLLPDFALILCGYLLCRFTLLDRVLWSQIERLVYYFLFPVLLFQSVLRAPITLGAALNLSTAAALLITSSVAMSYGLRYLPWVNRFIDARAHAASVQIAFRFHSFIALAISERLVGPQGIGLVGLIIGLCVPIVNVAAVYPMLSVNIKNNVDNTPSSEKNILKNLMRQLLQNPLLLSTCAGLLANFAGLSIPAWLQAPGQRLGNAALVMGLMAAGAGMQVSALGNAKALAAGVLGIKHVMMPLIAWALAWFLPLTHAECVMLLVFAGLPTASSCYVLASRMGYVQQAPAVASMITFSTLLALLSLPFALSLPLPR